MKQGKAKPDVAALVSLKDFQASHANVFPSLGSLEWHLRQHRREYVRGRALFEIGGRLLVDPAAFEGVLLELGAVKAIQ
jgi:hypothetical protein